MGLKRKAIMIVTTLLLFTSCSYNFSEDYFKEIQINNPNSSIILTGFTNGEETSSSKIIEYAITGTGNQEFEMIVKVNEVEIYRSEQRTGEFYLFVDDLDDTGHKLSIEYNFPSNSGTLADTIGGEFFVFEGVYDFFVDKTLADPFGIESVNIEQGSIYINLNPITNNNFDEAFLLIKNEYDFLIEERPISQTDMAELKIHDDQTIEYNPSYAIKIKNAFSEKTSEYVLLPTTKMSFIAEPILSDSYKLVYNEHPLYGNIEKMRLQYLLFDINPKGGETIVNNDYFFGDAFSINIEIFRNNTLVKSFNELIQIGKNLPISEFEEMTYIPSLDKYFVIDVTNNSDLIIHQLNAQSYSIETSKTITTLDFSGDFKSLEVDPTSNNLIINMSEKAIVFNPTIFSITSTYTAIDYNSNKPSADVYFRGDYVILEEPWPSGQVLIYETVTKTQKFIISKTTNFFSAVDASFFYANGGLYKLEAGDFVYVDKIRDSSSNTDAPPLDRMVFNKLSNSAVFGWYRNTHYLDLASNQQTIIRAPDEVYEVSYTDDGRPFINSGHFSAGNKSHIYDINLNETKLINTFAKQSYRYFNGVIFSPNGFYLESNLFTY